MTRRRKHVKVYDDNFVMTRESMRVVKATGYGSMASSATGIHVAHVCSDEHVVRIYDVSQGTFTQVAVYGHEQRPGRLPGFLRTPMGVCFTPANTLLIADKSNCRIVECDVYGSYVRHIRTHFPPRLVQVSGEWICYTDFWLAAPRVLRYDSRDAVSETRLLDNSLAYFKVASMCSSPLHPNVIFAVDTFGRSISSMNLTTRNCTLSHVQCIPRCLCIDSCGDVMACNINFACTKFTFDIVSLQSSKTLLQVSMADIVQLPYALYYNQHLGIVFKDTKGRVYTIRDMWQRADRRRAFIETVIKDVV